MTRAASTARRCELLDMPTTTPILQAIFGDRNYYCWGAGDERPTPQNGLSSL